MPNILNYDLFLHHVTEYITFKCIYFFSLILHMLVMFQIIGFYILFQTCAQQICFKYTSKHSLLKIIASQKSKFSVGEWTITTMDIILWEFLMLYHFFFFFHHKYNEAWLLLINWYIQIASRIAERLKI